MTMTPIRFSGGEFGGFVAGAAARMDEASISG
jgi:hypothetical protein